jgi:hypothetical protein
MKLTANQLALHNAERQAHFEAFEAPKPAVTIELNGLSFEVSYRLTNRKCFDNLATPTIMVKVDGKRTAWLKAVEMAE